MSRTVYSQLTTHNYRSRTVACEQESNSKKTMSESPSSGVTAEAIDAGRVAFVFPGQGTQFVGMGRDVYESSPRARRVFHEADSVLGFALSRLCFEGPAEDLQDTINAQPAILTVSVASLESLREKMQE